MATVLTSRSTAEMVHNQFEVHSTNNAQEKRRRGSDGKGNPSSSSKAIVKVAVPAAATSPSGAKLMHLINKKQFDTASLLLEAMERDGEEIAENVPSNVLIAAVNYNAPLPFLEALIRVLPNCIHKRDRKGKSALHAAACVYHAATPILIKTFPGALKVRSFKGLLPIHYACRHQAPVNIIDCMAIYMPDAQTQLTKLGWTPLHVAIAHRAPEDTITRLCCSMALRIKTSDGARLPIHVAAVAGCTTKVATLLLNLYPEGAKVRDGYSKTALDYVIDYKRWELSKIFFLADTALKGQQRQQTPKKRRRTHTIFNDTKVDASVLSAGVSGIPTSKRPRSRNSSVSF